MKLNNDNNQQLLTVEAEQTDSTELKELIAQLKDYQLYQSGACIFAFNKNNDLIVSIKPFDNTIFIIHEDGFKFAALFGGKRFPTAELFKLNEHDAKHFDRDFAFPLELTNTIINYKSSNLAEMLTLYRANFQKFYEELSLLFNNCANFTIPKQLEFSQNDLEDKYCRFNLQNNGSFKELAMTDHVFLHRDMDIVGTISMSIIQDKTGVEVYLYDEIVNYFILMTEQEKQNLKKLLIQKQEIESLEKELQDQERLISINKQIDHIVEPKRNVLMAELFEATKHRLAKIIPNFEMLIKQQQIHTIIRTAAGREDSYLKLGCQQNNKILVIHGKPTILLSTISDKLKTEWAQKNIRNFSPPVSNVSFLQSAPQQQQSEEKEKKTIQNRPMG